MSLRKVIQLFIAKAATSRIGTIAGTPKKYYADGVNWIWAADVLLTDGQLLRRVPISFNNRDISYAELGKPIQIGKMSNGTWCVDGLAKVVTSTTHTMYLSFADNTVAIASESYGNTIRRLTYGELGTALNGKGYGRIPLGAWGWFDADGNLVEILEG